MVDLDRVIKMITVPMTWNTVLYIVGTINVNPELINRKRLFHWGGTISVAIKSLFGGTTTINQPGDIPDDLEDYLSESDYVVLLNWGFL